VTLNFSQTAGRSASFPDAVSLIGDALRDFVWVSSWDGSPLYQNRPAAQYSGCSTVELQERGWSSLCHPEDRVRFEQTWQAATTAGEQFELEFRVRRRDGAYRWFLAKVSPIDANGAEHTHWIATLTDVHRHRLLESELHRAVRHRDEFLATLAHELRTPLQAIRQALSVAQSPMASAEVSMKMHAIVDRQLKLLLRFTNDSLDVSRVRWNAMALIPSSVTLAVIAADTLERARPLIEEHATHVEVEVLDPDCEVIADHERLVQALGNVLNNAVKYSPAGAHVHFRVHCEDGEAVFTVQDAGCGIEPERLSEIFDLFTRAPRGAANRPEGLGVGLAVAQHVAMLHGGSLAAESEGLGLGSRFTLRIPLAVDVAS
jgi:PAS domain S-box-containing protein